MLHSIQRTLRLLHNPPFSPTLPHLSRLINTSTTTTNDASAFAASYLANSCCCLTPSAAASAAEKLRGRLKSSSNPDAVLQLLKSHGFTQPQLAHLISSWPPLLLAHPETTLRPKLDFLRSIGVGPDRISTNSHLLYSSLESRLRPNFQTLLEKLGSVELVVSALRGSARFLFANLHDDFLPCMEILRRYEVPDPTIVKLVATHPQVLWKTPQKLAKEIEVLKGMGIYPSSKMFPSAVRCFSGTNASTWKRKIDAYKAIVGWSETETLSVFAKFPCAMVISEDKIKKVVGFLAEKLGWDSAVLFVHPSLLSASVEKKMVPRLSVWDLLVSKGVVNRAVKPNDLMISKKDFLAKYVDKYGDKYPEVLEAYHGKSGAARLL